MPNEPLTFVVFAGDIVTFAIKKILNVDWRFPFQTSSHRKTFHTTLGQAALVFRERHADEFAEMIADNPNFVAEDVESAVDYHECFVGKHFKGRVPLMELLVYCAFLVDLTVCCVENGRTDLIDDIVSETYDVYDDHVKPYFDIVGGWLALLRIARDYLCFVESMRVYSVLVAADCESDAPIPRVTTNASTDSSRQANHTIICPEMALDAKAIKSNAYYEKNGASSTGIINIIPSLETKASQGTISMATSSLDADYIQALAIETSSIDSDDFMSISSVGTDDSGGIRRPVNKAIASGTPADKCVISNRHCISSLFTDDRQVSASEMAGIYSEDITSIICSNTEDSNNSSDSASKYGVEIKRQNGFLQRVQPRDS